MTGCFILLHCHQKLNLETNQIFVSINDGLVLYYWIIVKLNYVAFVMDIFSSKPPDFGLSEIKNIVYDKFGLVLEAKILEGDRDQNL